MVWVLVTSHGVGPGHFKWCGSWSLQTVWVLVTLDGVGPGQFKRCGSCSNCDDLRSWQLISAGAAVTISSSGWEDVVVVSAEG